MDIHTKAQAFRISFLAFTFIIAMAGLISLPLQHHPLLPLLEHHNGSMLHIKQIHANALKSSSSSHQDHLLFFYSRLVYNSANADISYASRLLDNPTFPSINPNPFCYNSLIRAYSYSKNSHEKRLAIHLYLQMLLSGVYPDNHTFPFVLKSCAYLFVFSEGSQIHSHIFKLGFSSDIYVANSLVHFYSSCGHLTEAREIFDSMPTRNRVSWNVIIDAYAVGGEYETALDLFRQQQIKMTDLLPDSYTMQSVLCACAGLGSLSLGMWAHAFMVNKCDKKILDDVLINNSLIDLYCKCGAIGMARQIFDRMPIRDVASWNAMILGFSTHGLVGESLDTFEDMRRRLVKPDSITFVAVLSACKHGGLLTDGQRYFNLLTGEFGLEARLEHFGCMVDMLARAGSINEALEVVNSMHCKPDVIIWRSILDACCKANAEIDISSSLARQALESEDDAVADTSGTYVLLSKIYALANRWNDVGSIRRIMSEKGIKKEPGCSSIEMDGFVHEFLSGDTSHPRSEEIYEKMNEIEHKLSSVGYKPDSSQAVMVDGHEGEKTGSLRFHSERLAIAFGLLNMNEGKKPIRILKNLRVCGDCHTITKLISSVYGVDIIVRDRTRFHHFKDGSCSCMDFW